MLKGVSCCFGYLSAISPYIGGIIVWGLIGALWKYIEVLWVNTW